MIEKNTDDYLLKKYLKTATASICRLCFLSVVLASNVYAFNYN